MATLWLPILLLFLSGCSVALHIGNVPAALPVLREQMQLTLTQSGLVVSLYSMLIATLGVLLGLLQDRRRRKKMLVHPLAVSSPIYQAIIKLEEALRSSATNESADMR